MIGSVTGGSSFIFGPLAALSADQLGFKATGCIGTLTIAISTVVCYLSKDIILFGIFHGLLVGVALSFLYQLGEHPDFVYNSNRKLTSFHFRNHLLCILLQRQLGSSQWHCFLWWWYWNGGNALGIQLWLKIPGAKWSFPHKWSSIFGCPGACLHILPHQKWHHQ